MSTILREHDYYEFTGVDNVTVLKCKSCGVLKKDAPDKVFCKSSTSIETAPMIEVKISPTFYILLMLANLIALLLVIGLPGIPGNIQYMLYFMLSVPSAVWCIMQGISFEFEQAGATLS